MFEKIEESLYIFLTKHSIVQNFESYLT